MSNHRFTQAERHAVYTVHGQACYINGEPLTMKTVEVDHVVPEHLANDPDALAQARKKLGLPPDFDINSYENWLPACRECNQRKRGMVWEPSLLAQASLQRASERAPRAREVAARLVSDKRIANAMAILEAAEEQGELSDDVKASLRPLLEAYVHDRSEEASAEAVRVTPSYTVPLYELLSDDGVIAVVKGPFGIGGGPSDDAPPAMRCSTCGLPYFNGARCAICGSMDDD